MKRPKGKRGGTSRQRIPVTLTQDEQTALIAVPQSRYPTGLRNKAMIRLMLDTGLRVSEALHLDWRDLDLMTGKLHVREGKGGKDRILWVRPAALELLQTWRQRQATLTNTFHNGYVFTTLKGKRISPRYIQQMIKRYAIKAGIDKNITPHAMRHTFATDLYRESKDIRLVQKALGHADLSTTMIYTHIVDGDLEDAMRTFRDGDNNDTKK